MSYGLRRALGWVALAADIAVAVYLFYGPARDWEGGMEWVYRALMFTAMAAIHLIVKLIFPSTGDEATQDGAPHQHQGDAGGSPDIEQVNRRNP
ncbi:hypothetical protein ABZ330_17135 [Streptomyces sp. NPDC006172]|uniref:hypothetical protein n=1 Tax=Streptomyces sp. NPDC006172 TaxID=3154470 RepID=UPI0033EE0EA2